MVFFIKGALCSFVEDILIRGEDLIFLLYICFYDCVSCICLYVADPATFLASKTVFWYLNFLREQLVRLVIEKKKKRIFPSLCYYLIKIQILNIFSKTTQCPFELIFYVCRYVRLEVLCRLHMTGHPPSDTASLC